MIRSGKEESEYEISAKAATITPCGHDDSLYQGSESGMGDQKMDTKKEKNPKEYHF